MEADRLARGGGTSPPDPPRAALTRAALALGLIASACAAPGLSSAQPEPRPSVAVASAFPPTNALPPTAPAAPTPTYPPPDRTAHPLVWFAPLPPMPTGPGRPFTGSDDFMALFDPAAPWESAAASIQVFKLYGEWVAYHTTDADLRQAVQDIQRRGLALAVEAGPLDAPPECGQGVESFAGSEEGRLIARRIRQAGGSIDLIALDEPYFYAHVYDGPNACHWPAERIASAVGAYVELMQAEFPGMTVGDTEPLAGTTTIPEYVGWLESYRAVTGSDLAFLHLDIDWGRPDWSGEALAMEAYGREHGIPIGMIYTGNNGDPSDEVWISTAGERVRRHEQVDGGRPDHVLFQSWNDKPDRVLPETEAFTFTSLVRAYALDPPALGFRREGAGANLALDKPVRVSAVEAGHGADLAVDGDTGTWWSAGAPPLQWIEIDLGGPYSIAQIRLTPSQFPAGRTIHRVLGRGPGTNDAFALLTTFDGSTEDLELLTYSPPSPWTGIQMIRIETVSSPSWVAWREIEVVDEGG